MSDMNDSDIAKLVPSILAAQELDDTTPETSVEHWLPVVFGDREMTEADKLLFAMSPINRAHYFQARFERRRKGLNKIAENDNTPRRVAAAATERVRVNAELMDDFELYFLPHEEKDWMVVVELKSEHLSEDERIELIDDEGKVWLSGIPDNGKVVDFRTDISDPRSLIPKLKFRIAGTVLS